MGRRFAILFSDVFLLLGPLILSVSLGSLMLCLGRLIVGFGIGIQMIVGPIYLQECAPLELRPKIVSSFNSMYFVGLIISYYSGILFPAQLFFMFGLALIPAFLQVILMPLTQNEPPLFLARIGNMINADRQLRQFYAINNLQTGYAFNSEEA
jgi:MFS family permease